MSAEDFIPNPFGPFVVGRCVTIRRRVLEAPTNQAEAGKDIAAARWVYRLRSYAKKGDAAVVSDDIIDKSPNQDADGKASGLDYDFFCGVTPRDSLFWEIVEVDTSIPHAGAKSGYQERILLRFRAAIEDAPVA